ncbi:MAG TPA: Rieske 2Fe-2S domain-containing protein [Planctomycetota bacterium]|nr:Rieske 2Fe-2S domain-containing protein [Planctomycetota bacterium]
MELSRREFIVGTAAAAGAMCTGCVVLNPAPTYDAAPDGTILLPATLTTPGAQIKVRLPGVDEPVLVWRTASDYRAASVVCTHRGREVSLNSTEWTLDCPCHGSRFKQDGAILNGPAKRPLKHYRCEVEGDRLRIHAS